MSCKEWRDRDEWRDQALRDASSQLPNRSSTIETGVEDLKKVQRLAGAFGRVVDAEITKGVPGSVHSLEALMLRLDPMSILGSVARKRLDAAHDVELAGVIGSAELIRYRDLPAPGGILVNAWTSETTLSANTPGVAVLANGKRTRTVLKACLGGGEHRGAYELPVLVEPAIDPANMVALAKQAASLARRARELIKRYAAEIGDARTPIGSLPLLFDVLRCAEAREDGGFVSDPVAFADVREFVNLIDEMGCEEIPVIARAWYSPSGKLAVPPDWHLIFGEPAGADAERPNALHGLRGRLSHGLEDVLFGRRLQGNGQLIARLPDVAGVAHYTRGALGAPSTRGVVYLKGISHQSYEGRRSVAVSNLDLSNEAGIKRASLGVEALFGSKRERGECRRRFARFLARFQVPSNSHAAARRLLGFLVLAYTPTVHDRVVR